MAQEERPRHARICRNIFVKLLEFYLALRLLAKTRGLKVTIFIQTVVKLISHISEALTSRALCLMHSSL